MAKLNRNGKSNPINESIYKKIRAKARSPKHRLIFDIAFYTGERMGAILQLQVADIYSNPHTRQLHPQITFRASTRKGKITRQIPIHPDLIERFKAYSPPDGAWLFPGREIGCHLSNRACDRMFRRCLVRASLDESGYSFHGFRRGFITDLHAKGTSLRVIQSLTGHKSMQVLSGYVDVSERQRQQAIALR